MFENAQKIAASMTRFEILLLVMNNFDVRSMLSEQ